VATSDSAPAVEMELSRYLSELEKHFRANSHISRTVLAGKQYEQTNRLALDLVSAIAL
jgi:hypothetical protein